MTTLLLIIAHIGTLALLTTFSVFLYRLNKSVQALAQESRETKALAAALWTKMGDIPSSILAVNKRIDDIFVVDAPSSPNAIPEPNKDDIEFSEDMLIDLPKNIKIEVEGGDSMTPPGYDAA